ncbi:hypothetical protein PUR34_19595 [Streptomyces sp. JV185]|uniref:hypothetical protein n=1 Tax=Streptomyces sp. JV185 TaxID=858638 RepID=UPI002E77CB06|nr:hypothetical protein [Streptomyces sp. JV185]MEE1770277.1 hypothetical protein [Streptomyces sp. JV185]
MPQDIEIVDAVCACDRAPTMLVTFASAAAPAPFLTPVGVTLFATSCGRPRRSAGRITGTGPACAIRFGSSNAAGTAADVWETRISEVPC